MTHRRYQVPQSRSAVQLLPPCLDDDVDPDNPVQAIDAFVQTLDWQALGFDHTEGRSGSAPPLLRRFC